MPVYSLYLSGTSEIKLLQKGSPGENLNPQPLDWKLSTFLTTPTSHKLNSRINSCSKVSWHTCCYCVQHFEGGARSILLINQTSKENKRRHRNAKHFLTDNFCASFWQTFCDYLATFTNIFSVGIIWCFFCSWAVTFWFIFFAFGTTKTWTMMYMKHSLNEWLPFYLLNDLHR